MAYKLDGDNRIGDDASEGTHLEEVKEYVISSSTIVSVSLLFRQDAYDGQGSGQREPIAMKRNRSDVNFFPFSWTARDLSTPGLLESGWAYTDGVAILGTHFNNTPGDNEDHQPPFLEINIGVWVPLTIIVDYSNMSSIKLAAGSEIQTKLAENLILPIINNTGVPWCWGGIAGGGEPAFPRFARAAFANMARWNRALTNAEILELHGVTYPGVYRSPMRFTNGLVSYWPTYRNDGLTIVDDIVGNYDMRKIGGITFESDPTGVETLTDLLKDNSPLLPKNSLSHVYNRMGRICIR